MDRLYTAAVERALYEAQAWSPLKHGDIDPIGLLIGLLSETECKAAILLREHELGVAEIRAQWPKLERLALPTRPNDWKPRFSVDLELSWRAAAGRLHECPQPLVFGTEHALLGLAASDHELSVWLRNRGVNPEQIAAQILAQSGCLAEWPAGDVQPLEFPEGMESPPQNETPSLSVTPQLSVFPDPAPMPVAIPFPIAARQPEPAGRPIGVLRVLDAAANRAREGLRVIEDYVRFLLDDRFLTESLKTLRHEFVAALGIVPFEHRLAARETERDVGTAATTPAERHRANPSGVLAANFSRLQEALRTLEEFGKLIDPGLAAAIERVRYRTYTLQRAIGMAQAGIARLADARLYVLVDGRGTPAEFTALCQSLVSAGVDVLQLRDKSLDDRTLLARARTLREIAHAAGVVFIVNDRPDLAALAQADGVHLGQEELLIKDARTILGPEGLIGVSTHSIEQARQAVLDGANYIGVGPTFPSQTKQFAAFPGLALLSAVSGEIGLPAFAIGGIHRENLGEVLQTGIRRIAVGAAVTAAPDPAAAAALRAALR